MQIEEKKVNEPFFEKGGTNPSLGTGHSSCAQRVGGTGSRVEGRCRTCDGLCYTP